MEELIKEIEEMFDYYKEYIITEDNIEYYETLKREVLSELKQMSCDTCFKFQKLLTDNNCPMNDHDVKHLKPTDFCSKWQKEK